MSNGKGKVEELLQELGDLIEETGGEGRRRFVDHQGDYCVDGDAGLGGN